jgi:hypothetical protein
MTDGVAEGLLWRYNAATPATCGVAMEVPLRTVVAVSLVYQSDVIESPGANMSNTDPILEKDATLSEMSVAPTVMASVTRAGEYLLASSRLLFPAATV